MHLIRYPNNLQSLNIIGFTIIPAPVPRTLLNLTIKAREDYKENFIDTRDLKLPDTLQKMDLYGFHLKSIDHVLPNCLIELKFGGKVFMHYTLPNTLKKLILYGNSYGGNIIIGTLPTDLEELYANAYKGNLCILSFDYPKSLIKLILGASRAQVYPIYLSSLPLLNR